MICPHCHWDTEVGVIRSITTTCSRCDMRITTTSTGTVEELRARSEEAWKATHPASCEGYKIDVPYGIA